MININKLLNNKQFAAALAEAEREIYLAAFKFSGGNQSETARLMNVSRGTLISKLKRFGHISQSEEKL